MLVAFMNEFMRPTFDLPAHREKAEGWTEALQQGEEYRTKGKREWNELDATRGENSFFMDRLGTNSRFFFTWSLLCSLWLQVMGPYEQLKKG